MFTIMQISRQKVQDAFNRILCSRFAQKTTMALIALTISAGEAKATQEVSSYQTPVSNLMKAIAAVIVLVGAFNVYFKMRASVMVA